MELFKILGTIAINNSDANKALSETSKHAKDSAKEVEDLGDSGEKSSGKLSKFFSGVGKAAGVAAKGIAVGLGAAATAIGGLATSAIKQYAEYEQLVGGSQLLFGDAFGYVEEQAKNAYKTVQMSTNEYLQQVNGFSTGLKTALGGNEQAAAELAHKIVVAEADIVAATGNSAENVQNAFNGIMKSNFTMLDNLQLGITPTKEGFQEVINKVNEWNKANGEATNYQIDNLADCQSALVDYIEMQGLAGYASNEAAGTIQGSWGMLKGAWSNLLVGFSDPSADLQSLINGVFESVTAFAGNLMPRISQVLTGIATAFETLVPMIVGEIPGLIEQILPPLIEGATALVQGLVNVLPSVLNTLMDALPALIEGVMSIVDALIGALPGIIQAIVAALPQILGSLISAIPAALKGVWDGISSVFGGLGKWFGEKFKGAKDAAVKAWSDAKEKWNGIKEKCAEGFSNIKDKIGTKFKEAKEAAQQKWSDAKEKFNGIKDKVVGAFSNLKDKISPYFSKAKENATKTWSTVKGSFEKIKNGDIVGAFSDLGSLMKGKFKTALNTAKQGFSKAASIGKDLVNGIWKGITNAKDWLLGKIKGFAKTITKGIKDFFGIKSPSRVMRDEVGKMLAEGVAVGIDENTDKVQEATEEMNKKILDAAKKKLEEYQTYNDMTLADEVAFWDGVRQQCAEGTDARLEADKKYLEAKKSMNDQLLTAEQKLQEDLEGIQQTVVERTKELLNITGSGFGEALSGDEILGNLKHEVFGLEEYEKTIAALEAKIGGTKAFEDIKAGGIGNLNKAYEMVHFMSDEQLKQYVDLYERKYEAATKLAQDETAEEVVKRTAEAYQTYASTCDSLGVEIVNATDTMQQGVSGHFGTIETSINNVSTAFTKLKELFATFDWSTIAPSVASWFVGGSDTATSNPAAYSFGATETASGEQGNWFIEFLQKFLESMQGMKVVLDSGAVVGELVIPMDEALGELTIRKDRGR